MDVSHVNYSRYTDRVLDELYQKQSKFDGQTIKPPLATAGRFILRRIG